MARHPEWFERLDPIIEVVRQSHGLEWLGRQEVKAVFCCSERDSICEFQLLMRPQSTT